MIQFQHDNKNERLLILMYEVTARCLDDNQPLLQLSTFQSSMQQHQRHTRQLLGCLRCLDIRQTDGTAFAHGAKDLYILQHILCSNISLSQDFCRAQ